MVVQTQQLLFMVAEDQDPSHRMALATQGQFSFFTNRKQPHRQTSFCLVCFVCLFSWLVDLVFVCMGQEFFVQPRLSWNSKIHLTMPPEFWY